MTSVARRAGPRALPPFRRLLASSCDTVRESAIDRLTDAGDTESIPAIRALLRGGDVFDVEGASRALVKFGAKDAVPDLVAQFKNANPTARIDVAEALVGLRARSAIPALARAAAHEPVPWAKTRLAEALYALKKGTPLPP